MWIGGRKGKKESKPSVKKESIVHQSGKCLAARGGFLRYPANTVTQRVVISATKSLGFVRSNKQVKSLLLIFPTHTLMTPSPANELVTLHRDFCGLFYLWLMSGIKGEGVAGSVRMEVGVSWLDNQDGLDEKDWPKLRTCSDNLLNQGFKLNILYDGYPDVVMRKCEIFPEQPAPNPL